jgi:itaconate CoA-transferase
MPALPLSGITVVSLEQAVSAPFATRQLADLGARVIKIERPDGGDFARSYDTSVNGLSSYFVWLNRSKESLTLDLKRPEAQSVLARLLERADVFVQNLAPGAAGRLGAASAELRSRYPRLIVCNVTGYGSTGPYADRKAYDLLVQSEVGLVSITGTPETPSKVGISIADISAGMYAYSGILTALFTRATTGAGAALEVSLFDSMAEWMGAQAYYTAGRGAPPARSGPNHASIAPYGVFKTRDGAIYLGIQNAREWTRFCADVLRQPALSDDARFHTNALRVEHRRDLQAIVESVFATLTSAEVLARLDAAQIASAHLNDIAGFLNHPQLVERGRWHDVPSPAGPVRMVAPPVQIDGVTPALGAIPALGEHTASILTELGFDGSTIATFQKNGVV